MPKRKRIADPRLAQKGKLSYEWAQERMPIIEKIIMDNTQSRMNSRDRSRTRTKERKVTKATEKPLEGIRVGFCLHITKETSVLVMAAKRLGAKVALCSANPLSVQDDIAAFLQKEGVDVFAWRGETEQEYKNCIMQVLSLSPQIITDDGGDLHAAAHKARTTSIYGGTEETTSGVKRLLALEKLGQLMYPVIAVNNARTKYLFDNRHGTGQSTLDGVMRASGIFLPGSRVVVCGYGWVGKGVAAKARGMGANVTVTEIDPIKAIEAKMDGFEVKTLADSAVNADLFITCTGQKGVIRREHFEKMKDGAILANAGHFDVEIDTHYLYLSRVKDRKKKKLEGRKGVGEKEPRPGVERFDIAGKKIYLLSKGRVVNLVAAEGHPPEVMALSFANQLLSILHIAMSRHSRSSSNSNKDKKVMEKRVYNVPEEIDIQVAKNALDAMNVRIDTVTKEQKRYQNTA